MSSLCVSLLLAALPLAPVPQAPDERPAAPGEWGFRPGDGARVARTPPAFSWRPQEGAASYELEASRDASFERVDYAVRDVEWSVHCPPRTFEPGEWAWRFRFVDAEGAASDWSSVRRFTVPEGAAEFTLPEREELLARIPTEHPRLFLRPEDLPRLREQARGPLRERFEALERQCEAWLAEPPSTAEPPRYPEGTVYKSEEWRAIWWGNRRLTIGVLEPAATLAFTWRIGGREEYAQLARRLLLDAARWDPVGATGYRYNDEAGMPYAYHFSRGYTLLHPLLEEDERELCRRVMQVRGREMHAHLAPRHLWRPYASHSNRAWHFLGEVGIAFHGELPEADDWTWFAANVFANVYPVWSDADGGWHEGLVYWRSYLGRFTWWADVQRAALGLDAYALPFFSSAGDFALYLMPPGTRGGGFGDLNARQTAEQNRDLMTVFAAQARNPYWQWYVEALGGPDAGAGWVGFLRSGRPAVEPRAPEDRPTSRCFEGTGVAVLNRTLTDAPDNVEVVFKSSPFGTQSHGYESQNAFLLYAFGERLLIRSGYRDIYGSAHHKDWMWQTKSVNSVTVGGRGQGAHSAAARGRITAFHTEPGAHFVEGEAAEAYGGRLETFRRGILFLEPDLIVVCDRLAAPEPASIEWRLHAPVPFEALGEAAGDAPLDLDPEVRDLVVRNGAAACRVTFFGPDALTLSQTDRFDPPPRERVQLVEYHLTAETPAAREAGLITVLRPFRAGEEPPAPGRLERVEGRPRLVAPLGVGGATVEVQGEGLLVRWLDESGAVTRELSTAAARRDR